MKTIILSIITVFLSLLACERIIDEKRELNHLDNDEIWESEELAMLFLNKVYASALPGFRAAANTSMSDESFGTGTGNMMFGLLTKENSYGNFLEYWNNIRRVNIILEEAHKGGLDEEIVALFRGQSFFLRAWMYWEMVLLYGGVPIVEEVADIQDTEKHLVARKPARECVEFMIRDLDSAMVLLPPAWGASDYGRVTRSAAAALKGRILLFWASPQFNPADEGQRWQQAYEANRLARLMAEGDGHALSEDFQSIFIDEELSPEPLFITGFDDNSRSHGYEDQVRPRSMSNSNAAVSSAPNWDLVCSFPMKDGFPVKDHAGYNEQEFWKDRDPRLYATVAWNGMQWDFDEVEGRRLQWTFLGNKVDGGTNASLTGFYLKKHINTSIPRISTFRTPTDWVEIRLAEVYLNLAEAATETGRDAEALELLGIIRERAGIENSNGSYGITATSGEELLEAVLLERKLELAFENKRHWDLRRRNMFINDLGGTPKLNGSRRHGIIVQIDTAYIFSLDPGLHYRYDTVINKITGDTTIVTLNPDTAIVHFHEHIADTVMDMSLSHDRYFDILFNTDMDPAEINFIQPKYNFYFIPENEMEKNANLRQTINWTSVDPFDPLADPQNR